MKIFIEKVSNNHQDSIWYCGTIAEHNGFELRALGQIRGEVMGEIMKNDSLVEYLLSRDLRDEDLFQAVHLIDNNWFEIVYPDGDSHVPDNQTYDDAIKELFAFAIESENSNA